MRTRWLVVSLIVLAAASPRAFAQSASVQAQSLFEEGRKLQQAGKLAEACAAFESSQKLDPAVTTLLNLADCREQNHQLATAWGAFSDANRMARTSSNDKLARVASTHAKKLEPRLSKLTISVPADRKVAGLEVLRGNDPVDPASWNHALPIDGGTYTITARAPGANPSSTLVTVAAERDTKVVEIPDLCNLPRDIDKSAAPPSPRVGVVPPIDPSSALPRTSSKVVPLVVSAGALALLRGGAWLRVLGRVEICRAEVGYRVSCTATPCTTQHRRDRNRERGTTTNVGVYVVPTATSFRPFGAVLRL
jgi:hypothetical protein